MHGIGFHCMVPDAAKITPIAPCFSTFGPVVGLGLRTGRVQFRERLPVGPEELCASGGPTLPAIAAGKVQLLWVHRATITVEPWRADGPVRRGHGTFRTDVGRASSVAVARHHKAQGSRGLSPSRIGIVFTPARPSGVWPRSSGGWRGVLPGPGASRRGRFPGRGRPGARRGRRASPAGPRRNGRSGWPRGRRG